MRIIIVEDDLNIRRELKILLENALYDVSVIEKFDDVAEQILKINADMVLLDINLPNNNGLHICSGIRQASDIPIIFVTSQSTSIDELNGIMMGGDDYISKPYNAPVLLARIGTVLKRNKKNEKSGTEKITYKGAEFDVLAGTISYENQSAELTKNEIKILYYLLIHKGKIVNRADLVEYLWDNQIFIDDNTLSVNITRVRGKLEEIGLNGFIETKRGLGYKV